MPIMIEVITRDLNDLDALPTRRVVDHNIHSDRVWLGNHQYWAARHGRSVTVAPIEGDA